jgi:hypothetical protein
MRDRPADSFELLLFSVDPPFIAEAVAGGIDGILVDWERRGKRERQAGADTQVSSDTPEDLDRVRSATASQVILRLNPPGPQTAAEIERAIASGADELLLPMVRSAGEVESALGLVGGRCGLGILVETPEAVIAAGELARLPLSRAYVGLNDLAIARRHRNIFCSVTDGSVERLRCAFADIPFGFGGLTLPDRGRPVPCRLLIAEMARLSCDFAFLRRSYKRDVPRGRQAAGLGRMRRALYAARWRSPEMVQDEQRIFERAVAAWRPGSRHRLAQVS